MGQLAHHAGSFKERLYEKTKIENKIIYVPIKKTKQQKNLHSWIERKYHV